MEIVDLVNDLLPKHRHHKVTHGDVVKALILNGLGFVQRRLYLFPEYFENKAVHRLFGKDITAEDFTDDVIGRTLDAIKEYGPEKLFHEIISQVFVSSRKSRSPMRSFPVDTPIDYENQNAENYIIGA